MIVHEQPAFTARLAAVLEACGRMRPLTDEATLEWWRALRDFEYTDVDKAFNDYLAAGDTRFPTVGAIVERARGHAKRRKSSQPQPQAQNRRPEPDLAAVHVAVARALLRGDDLGMLPNAPYSGPLDIDDIVTQSLAGYADRLDELTDGEKRTIFERADAAGRRQLRERTTPEQRRQYRDPSTGEVHHGG